MFFYQLAKEEWKKAGLYKSKKGKVKLFLKFVEENQDKDLVEYLNELRKNYPEVIDDILLPLFDSDDGVIKLEAIEHADLSRISELNKLKEKSNKLDATDNEIELIVIARKNNDALMEVIKKRKDLRRGLKKIVFPNKQRLLKSKNIRQPPEELLSNVAAKKKTKKKKIR